MRYTFIASNTGRLQLLLQLLQLVVLLSLTWSSDAAKNAPGVSFIGVGYNILRANPDEGDQSRGGVDPGILTTRRIFEITWDQSRQSSDQKYTVPDQVIYHSRESCFDSDVDDVITDDESLQENLKRGLSFDIGGGIPILSKLAFAAKPGYKKEVKSNEKERKVYKKSTNICNLGAARYRTELAAENKYGLSEGFRQVICDLPAEYDEGEYMQFLETWGTEKPYLQHVITEVDVGVKTVKKIETTVGEMFSFASREMGTGAVKAGGAYQGMTGSLEFNMDNFKKSETTRTWNKGKTTEYVVGTEAQPEPIKLVLKEIDHTLKEEYWKAGKAECGLEARAAAVVEALEAYPTWLGAKEPKHESLKIPLTWPKGTYALPQTDARCPSTKHFVWDTGRRTQLTGSGFETKPEKERMHFPRGWFEKVRVTLMTRYKVTQHFCLKSKEKFASYEMDWPAGQYCVIKLGDCPTREFEKGSITWDDRSSEPQNVGALPDGDFSTKGQTTIAYCCRDDGVASNAIFLPTDKPFHLLRFGGQCQKVQGMESIDEMIHWDEPEFVSDTTTNGVHPDNTSKKNVELHYCYYHTGGADVGGTSLVSGLFKIAKGMGTL